jgi:hypothetical protein
MTPQDYFTNAVRMFLADGGTPENAHRLIDERRKNRECLLAASRRPGLLRNKDACFVVCDWRDQFYFRSSSDVFTHGVGVSYTNVVSLFLRCCSASLSHVFAISIRVRLLWRSLNVWASVRHFSAFCRYRSNRSSLVMRQIPTVPQGAFFAAKILRIIDLNQIATTDRLSYVYFEDEPGRRAAAKLLTRDERGRLQVHSAAIRKN